jgi:hypothetical protein
MAKVEHTSDARVLVGIDISKHRHEVLIAVPGKTRRRRLTNTNGTDDFMRLIAILREYGMQVRIGFEATGNYHRVLMYHLGVAGLYLKLVSSVALARTREALHNRWDKNDPKDAQVTRLHWHERGGHIVGIVLQLAELPEQAIAARGRLITEMKPTPVHAKLLYQFVEMIRAVRNCAAVADSPSRPPRAIATEIVALCTSGPMNVSSCIWSLPHF